MVQGLCLLLHYLAHFWQVYWLDFMDINQNAKNHQRLKFYGHFRSLTTDGQMDSLGNYRALFESQPFNRSNRSTFQRVVQMM